MIVGGGGQSAGGTFLESLCPSPTTIAGEGLGRFTEPPTTSRRWYVYRPIRPTNAYGRYHHLRDVAR